MKRINDITESPCYKCEVVENCNRRCYKSVEVDMIKLSVCYDAEYDKRDCPIYIAETAFITEEEDG